MKLKDIFSIAMTNIRHRHLRSWLTILGIVIGVAAIISLIGVSMGVSAQISQRINTLGSNIITVSPGGQQAQRIGGFGGGAPGGGRSEPFGGQTSSEITFREADQLRTIPGVYRLDARVQKRETVEYKNKNSSHTVIGTEPQAFKDSVGTDVLYGRFLSTNDQYSAVIGYDVANATFDDFDILNKQIKIGGVPFRVVGILQKTGSFGGTDSAVFIPQTTAKNLFNQSSVSQIVIVTSPDHDTDAVAADVEDELLTLHRLTPDEKDFQVMTASTVQSAVSGITDTLAIFLGGIASISLIVGGIGVANTMFMSVLEQTKDIGVFKSLGAKNRDVTYLFLCEAGIIGFVGGFLGVALSFVVSGILGAVGVPTATSPELIIGGLLFSVVIGIVAGLSPARNAASIPPIEALRYE
jgi:putative ABC transport system permease protein